MLTAIRNLPRIYSFPATLHPMTQLAMGVAALNSTSEFAAAYEKGMKKTEYWKPALEDSLTLIARLPALAARIYRNVYKPGEALPRVDKNLDLVGKLSSIIGETDSLMIARGRELHEHARLWRERGFNRVSPSLHRFTW